MSYESEPGIGLHILALCDPRSIYTDIRLSKNLHIMDAPNLLMDIYAVLIEQCCHKGRHLFLTSRCAIPPKSEFTSESIVLFDE